MPSQPTSDLKLRTAHSVKWNLIDKASSQVIYAVTGIILARVLTKEDFGLVGAVLVFQAFASLFVDSGFSYALIQKKNPTRLDYSTVLWFNLAVALGAYLLLFAAAPLIAWCFDGDQRLIPLSRVMFVSFILNASAIVQTNRLMKSLDVRLIALSNTVGLTIGAGVGIWLALAGFGAWAVVWQTIAINGVKSLVLWLTSKWRPLWAFSWSSLKGFFSIGSGMMLTSLLNTVFQNIYSFFIGNRAGLARLGDYYQADKWSKMGITTISQTVTSAFLPGLSQVQDDPERFTRVSTKMNRFTAYLVMPSLGFLAMMALPIFHILFGTKWDSAVPLFQLLLVRGVFTVLVALYNNYLIAMARTRIVVQMETLRDSAALIFLLATLPFVAMGNDSDPVFGIKVLLLGQIAASAITWTVMVGRTAAVTGRTAASLLSDNVPYLLLTLLACAAMWAESLVVVNPWGLVLLQTLTGVGLYLGANRLLGSNIQRELLGYLLHRGGKSSERS